MQLHVCCTGAINVVMSCVTSAQTGSLLGAYSWCSRHGSHAAHHCWDASVLSMAYICTQLG